MTDQELIAEMKEAVSEIRRQREDPTISARELKITMRIVEMLIDKWIDELPADDPVLADTPDCKIPDPNRCPECGGYLGDYGNCVTFGCGGGAD
jgi:hypothetical protein